MSRTVLVVDDEAYIRQLIAHVLNRAGCVVFEAADGEQALTALREHPETALVISDLGMPHLDGFGLLERLAGEQGPPVVILTSRGQESDERRARELGAVGVITKPFARQDLLRVIERHLPT
ncbi:response regulator [Deinococcus yavapaiensis]|uniref:Response regulator receiver domain-containing protein n=1 Tax=Deinococcus yavapaiensis KR-236 TaxID=694435 RepID=A0A318S183_9DEIO|nr:response regulator [Deinococcus yavapaiensis]PYE49903.1 response regulator receiver domain-containing protein [Deinococcus yavapaiensis KR-236]